MPGECHGQRSLADRGPWGQKQSDTTEATKHARTTYMWNLKYGTNEPVYVQKQTHRCRVVVAKGEGGRGSMDWEFGVRRYELLHAEWINPKHPTV